MLAHSAVAAAVQRIAAGVSTPLREARDVLNFLLGGSIQQNLETVKTFVLFRIWIALAISISLSGLLVAIQMYMLAMAYKNAVLQARQGRYPGGANWKWTRPAKSAKFVGSKVVCPKTRTIIPHKPAASVLNSLDLCTSLLLRLASPA